MSVTVSLNGSNFTIPQTSETGWGAQVTAWIQSVSLNTLQKNGGTFTLTAEADFGGSFGLKVLYIKSQTANAASAGVVRLANTDLIKFRNNANSADLSLGVSTSDKLQFESVDVVTVSGTQTLTNKTLTAPTMTVPLIKNALHLEDPGGGTNKIILQAPTLAGDYTLTMPVDDGTSNQVLQTNGSGVLNWATVATANLAVTSKTTTATLTTGELGVILASTAGGAYTLTLPTAVGNTGLAYYIKKTTSDNNKLTIDADGSETINGVASLFMWLQNESAHIVSNGTNWDVVSRVNQVRQFRVIGGGTTQNPGTTAITKLVAAWNTVSEDPTASFTIGTGVFTVPEAGTYVFNSRIPISSFTAAEVHRMWLYVNGVAVAENRLSQAGTTVFNAIGYQATFAVGDTIDIRSESTADTSYTIGGSEAQTQFWGAKIN
jgi:hypothetical protein